MKWLQDFFGCLFKVFETSLDLKRALTLVDKASEDDLKKIIPILEQKIRKQS